MGKPAVAEGTPTRRRGGPRRAGGMSRRDKWRLTAALLGLMSLVLVVWLWRRGRAWTGILTPREETTSPWTAVDMLAKVSPAPRDSGEWTWKWSVLPTADLDGHG